MWSPPYPVNVLTKAGLDELTAYVELMELPDFQPRPITKKLPFHTLDHEVKVRDVAVQFQRAITEQDWGFGYWIGDEDFEMWKGDYFTGQMIPDGFFLIDDGPRTWPHFLEIDMGTQTVVSGVKGGTTTIKDWRTKMERYLDYLPRFANDSLFAGLTDPIVLIVTTSSDRMQSLKKAAFEVGCRGMFWFTTFEQFGSEWPASALNYIWTTPHEKTARSFANRITSQGPSQRSSQRR